MSTGENPKVKRCVRSQVSAIGGVPNKQMMGRRDVAVCSKDLVTQT